MLKQFLTKPVFVFVETGYLPVIGLCDVTWLQSSKARKEGSWWSEMQLCNHYIDGLWSAWSDLCYSCTV